VYIVQVIGHAREGGNPHQEPQNNKNNLVQDAAFTDHDAAVTDHTPHSSCRLFGCTEPAENMKLTVPALWRLQKKLPEQQPAFVAPF